MTPQSNILVIAPLKKGYEGELRTLLDSMNFAPGIADPANVLVPFQEFPQIHVARFVILDDRTTGDMQAAYGLSPQQYPPCLAFLADFDGPTNSFCDALATGAKGGLEKIFSYCEGFEPGTSIAEWMNTHNHAPATIYINWLGRTVTQIREEEALRLALEDHLQKNAASYSHKTLADTHAALHEFVQSEVRSGKLKLSPQLRTPLGWSLRNIADLIMVPLVLLLLLPILIFYLPIFLVQLRRREKKDPVIAPRVEVSHTDRLAILEDHDVTNQFTAMGSVKPGVFRRWTLAFFLWVLNWTTRHVYTRGQLARVPTIHFARWVFIDDKKRLLFASNYDGALETYMDDFINKVGWGLNLVFGNGIGYPTTNWLVLDGAKDEQSFKYFLRRHQLPTNVWYKAYPGLTAFDLKRNTLIRKGIERARLPDTELQQWVALL
jgi:hypothetical protein